MTTTSKLAFVLSCALFTAAAVADPFTFSTGDPDGLIGTASRPFSPQGSEIETADDFILTSSTQINGASFTGLLTGAATSANVSGVSVAIYRVFPKDSTNPPSGNVPTRVNSPSDTEFVTRSTGDANLTFTTTTLNPDFAVANTVINGINKAPNQFTGGEGLAKGIETRFDITFTTPLTLPPDHYFFVPQVQLSLGNLLAGDFLWLSAPKPITAGTPFTPDLQSWTRDTNLDPDWLRIGTDITHQGPFNASYSLTGETVPEPSSLAIVFGAAMVILSSRRSA
jgi:hypothetical protein